MYDVIYHPFGAQWIRENLVILIEGIKIVVNFKVFTGENSCESNLSDGKKERNKRISIREVLGILTLDSITGA